MSNSRKKKQRRGGNRRVRDTGNQNQVIGRASRRSPNLRFLLAVSVCGLGALGGFLLWKSSPRKPSENVTPAIIAPAETPREIASAIGAGPEAKQGAATRVQADQLEQPPRATANGTLSVGGSAPLRDINVAPPINLRRMSRRQAAGSKKWPVAASERIAAPRGRPRLSFTENPIWAPIGNETLATFWWDDVPEFIAAKRVSTESSISNIRPEDYVGAEACKSCHAKNYQGWAMHPHRWMNAKVNSDTVMGDFTGTASATIRYRSGTAEFYEADGQYRMRLHRDDVTRLYAVNRTIGSRFQQYYVGTLLEGPEPDNHPIRKVDHVLPFGYWLDKQEWVPVVHVELELPDDERHDPFSEPANRPYDRSCASCHTTQPAGDRMLRAVGRERLAAYSPHEVSYHGIGYLRETRPEVVEWGEFYGKDVTDKIRKSLSVMDDLPAEKYAAALGITCEACHNGGRLHAEQEEQLPRFFPSGEHVYVSGTDAKTVWGRNPSNVNWSCAQCHSGGRSMFACGASTWNSTEYSDAMRGACYDKDLAAELAMNHLTCVHCHDPHEATGKRWKHSAESDDQRCLACHDQFRETELRLAHTHHPAGTAGDRCMNCHMPRINEGMQDVVRSHLIFSPTDTAMLENNHPNACNLCHLDKKIDWTLDHLAEWYGIREDENAREETPTWKRYSNEKLAENYPDREAPVSIGWLKSNHQATRLVAVEALARARAAWALPEMLQILDDPYLVNRQFAAQRIEEMLKIDLRELGYRHYLYADERRQPLRTIRDRVLQP